MNDIPERRPLPKMRHKLSARATLIRLWPFLAILAIVLFPFDWLTQIWPAYGQVFNQVFVGEQQHLIGHSTLFFLLGLFTLIAFPGLRIRPLVYFGLMFLGALGEEALQSIFKQELPNLGDGRDIVFDLVGVIVAYMLIWAWRWVRSRGQQV